MRKEIKLEECQKSFVRVLLNDEEQPIDDFVLEVNHNKPEVSIPLEVGKLQRWSVQVGNFLITGRGRDTINVKTMFLMSPTLDPAMRISMFCSDVLVSITKHGNEYENIVRFNNVMVPG